MNKPLVAVVGRPNVGKSTFFNRIVGQRLSIVEDTPGVTRDRIYADGEWQRYAFTLVDTGGIEIKSDEELFQDMRMQAEIAIDNAQVILFFVDGRQGVTSSDHDVADMLRRAGKPVILVVNKIDGPSNDAIYDFYDLGMGDPMPISAAQGLGIGDLLDAMVAYFPDPDELEEEDEAIHIAVVGRPNVGKSSLVNMILNEKRSIVSDIAGTTRDAIDTPFERNGKKYVIIDTAGIRRKAKIEDASIERYSVIRSLMAIRRCDVALILIDGREYATEQDVKIAGLVHEEGKPSVVLVNKWDLVDKETGTLEQHRKRVMNNLSFMNYVPTLYISAKTGQRVNRVLEEADRVVENTRQRIPTGVLNDVINDAISVVEPPSDKGRRLKIYYATQVSTRPPTFVLFVNDPELMHFSYERYLENHLRKAFDFSGTPIRILKRQRNNKEDGGR
ncbi:ribosome biogenesis GTPase Der [Gehongia tenuis]|uniref:GTPase Der n=1 Tax=Gehongia tenuis TaxID=2763655 RepID=A0A926D328_9FIRM|nr:ribosome biogenesis GTPase Der [Gehongia tenuis]MBC8531490.1 ribosome biogenesis GTPase Der [Gehongia tenuis]